jgi:hypothetical protein
MESKRVFNQYFKIQNLLTSFKLYFNLRGTFFEKSNKIKNRKKKIFDFHIFDFIFGFLILKLVDE